VLVFPADDWSMSPPPTELAAPSEVDLCSPKGLTHMLSPPDAAWPAPDNSSSPEPPSVGPRNNIMRQTALQCDHLGTMLTKSRMEDGNAK
jgi:hypothetical protein